MLRQSSLDSLRKKEPNCLPHWRLHHFMKRLSFSLFLAATILSGERLSAETPIPQLVHAGSKYQLLVNGSPFLMLGGQAHNSSASNAEDLKPVWDSLVAMHANTAEVPVGS